MDKNIIQLLISLGGAAIIWFILFVLANISHALPDLQRGFELLGGISNGYIHALIYMAFIYGLLELYNNQTFIKEQYAGFELNLLPIEDQLVISPEEVAKIKLNTLDLERQGTSFLVTDFIKKACTQYRNDGSIGDTLQVFDAQVNSSKDKLEGGLELIRYVVNAIVSLGFIGTLLGLSTAIGKSHLAKTAEGMPEITGYLNVAFDTTLVALLLGLILNFFFHRYLGDLDTFFAKAKTYVIDNLISRIYEVK